MDIGLTPSNGDLIKELVGQKLYFKNETDVARFAFAYVMKNRLDMTRKDYKATGLTTKWSYETVDPDYTMKSLVHVLHPEEQNEEKYVQTLINLGLEEIGKNTVHMKINSIMAIVEDTNQDLL